MTRRSATWPAEFNVFLALVILVVVFELIGRIFLGDSFLFNTRDNVDGIFNEARLQIIILQVSIVGIIAIGVTQVIICGGIDLSSGSIVGATAMIAMSFAQVATVNGNPNPKAMFLAQGWTDLPVIVPVLVAIGCGLLAGLVNGSLIAYTRIPPFIATLGMMVTGARHRQMVVQGPADLVSDRKFRRHRQGPDAGHHLPVAGGAVPADHDLHQVRQALLRHRLQ